MSVIEAMEVDQKEGKQRIHFGSLEEVERQKLKAGTKAAPGVSAAVLAGMKAGNINVSGGTVIEKDKGSDRLPEKNFMLEEFEKRKRARSILVPTSDSEVKARLREVREPICLFGEGPQDRRERLRLLLADLAELGIKIQPERKEEVSQAPVDEDTVWYHEGSNDLLIARFWLAEYSMPRAIERLEKARIEAKKPGPEKAAAKQELHKKLRQMSNSCSQVGDTRPISFCQFSPDSKMLATGSWSGLCKIWSVPDCEFIRTLRGHNDRVGSIMFHPEACLSLPSSVLSIASCAADGSVYLWNLENEIPICELEDHAQRVARVTFHPSGRFIGTACYDHSWRLWDLEKMTEVLHQEGHSRPVYNVQFHPDGSLVGTCGMDSCARIWDLRSGKCLMALQGHLKNVLAIDFSPNGYHFVSGGDDNSMKIWDLRKGICLYTVPVHTNLISQLKFERDRGDYIVTSSYDNTAKIWGHPGWTPLRTLAGHEGKVMSVDISPDQVYIATSSYDRTFKLWEQDNSL